MTTESLPLNPKQLWNPNSPNSPFKSPNNMDAFRKAVNEKHRLALNNYQELYEWSVSNISKFWAMVWEYVHIISSQSYMQVINEDVSMDKIPEWFAGARLNMAQNLLRYRDERVAIISTGEFGKEYRLTYKELYDQVEKCASAMRQMGVKIGDRVVGYISNCIEAIVFMLAANSIGALWSSTSPDFGTTGVLDRFVQVKPKILISVNAVVYNGKKYDHLEKVKSVVEGLPMLEKIVIIDFISEMAKDDYALFTGNEKWISYTKFISNPSPTPLKFEQLPFNHPAYILYSSGTTGLPKCIVHSGGGTLIQHLKEHVIHGDMTRDDVFFQYTTTGWMMWNWLVSGLAVGCTIVLYDGSPFKPNEWILWDLAEKYAFTKFGTSAKYIQSMQEMSLKPATKYKLEKLNEIYSTGSPLRPESFDFVYDNIKSNICLGSITGGTDIVSLFAGHNHSIPVYRGEIQSRCLGMAVESWDDNGKPIFGQSGDLVCSKPFPCMPVFFWNDEQNFKYKEAYFSQVKSVWYHGDFVWINPNTKGVVMLGRSDGTLKPAGVRFGSAEIYNIIEKFHQIQDSLVVGQRRESDTDERVVLFLKMKEGQAFNQEIVGEIKVSIRKELSPRHVPAFILPISDIPYTINGKKVEVAVKKIVSGYSVTPSATLANPESLKLYENIPELK